MTCMNEQLPSRQVLGVQGTSGALDERTRTWMAAVFSCTLPSSDALPGTAIDSALKGVFYNF